MDEFVAKRFPTLSDLLRDTTLPGDTLKARSICNEHGAFADARTEGMFKSGRLLYIVCAPVMPHCHETSSESDRLEDDLTAIVKACGRDKVRSAFVSKLLNDDQFEDACYEVACAGVAAKFFDDDTLGLEALIGSKSEAKNSDICGTKGEHEYRVEVTVVHERLPGAVDPDITERLETINLPVGYNVLLRKPVRFHSQVEQVVSIIKDVYDHREDICDDGLDVCGFRVLPSSSSQFQVKTGPVSDIVFINDDPQNRMVSHPAQSRSLMDPNEWLELSAKNPAGCVTSADIDHDKDTHKTMPVSTKIWQILGRKRLQCEAGKCNIIAMGVPLPVSSQHVADALLGPVSAYYVRLPNGTFQSGGFRRKPSGPFVPEKSSEDVATNIAPFRIVSAVATFRLDRFNPEVEVYRNPNATVTLCQKQAKQLKERFLARCS